MRTFFVVVAVTLLAGFLYLVITRPEPTPLISLKASVYPLQMPPLAFADEDVELLSRASPSNVRVVPVKFDSAEALDKFRTSLQMAGRRFNYFRRGNQVVIVHIAAHGMVNNADQPCLVPPGADPFDSETWLPLAKVFDALQAEATLKGKKKIVLLDCQRVLSCWRCGWLENRFNDSIATAVKDAKDSDLYVISAADAGQINYSAPELRSSVFAQFLARALRGDGASRSNVSLLDLCRYVARNVAAYSRDHRDVGQNPVLVHGEFGYRLNDRGDLVDAGGQSAKIENFSLAYIDKWRSGKNFVEIRSSFDPLADAKRLLGQFVKDNASSDGKQSLNQIWQHYRERRDPPTGEASLLAAYSVDPVAWSSIQQRLSAVGERLFAGREYQGTALQTEIERLAKDLDPNTWRPRGTLPKLGVRQFSWVEMSHAEPTQAASENVFSSYVKTDPAKRDEVLPKRVSSTRLIKDIYAALIEESVTGDARANLRTALELFEKYRPPSDPYLLEEHFLTLISRGIVADERLSAVQLGTALKARQFAELAAGQSDPRVHYALESMVNAADEKRREAEDLVFMGGEARRSENLWREAMAELPGAGYPAAIAQQDRLAQCLQLRDEIWSDLPLLAEWCIQANTKQAQNRTQEFIAVLQGAIDLDDAIERTVRSHDEPQTFAARLERCQRAFQSVSAAWVAAHSDLEKVYDLPTNVEQRYRRGEYIRAAETALRFPPLVGSSSQFVERYLQTLEQWTTDYGTTAGNSKSENVSNAATATSLGEPAQSFGDCYPLFRELHRVLAYEFVDPFGQHRHAQPWDENRRADSIFRVMGNETGWRRIRKLLDGYNEAIASQSPSWSASQSAVAAVEKLRQWDRRVRVAGPWLASFQADLKRPAQPTPARWLQEFDAAHWSAWQAYRAKCDFWGNGQPPGTDSQRPYFADAIDQCEAALPEALRPIRYDIPGGGLVDFSERSPAALAALDRWQPIAPPRSLRAAARNREEIKIELAIQPLASETNAFRLPAGIATLSFQSPGGGNNGSEGNSVTGSFDSAAQDHTRPVALPLLSKEATVISAFVHAPADPQQPVAELNARLWYRGHVRIKSCPLPRPASAQFVEYEFVRPNYPPPTVEVRGKDTPRGAIMVVFDCSASMQNPQRFPVAKDQVIQLLRELDADSVGALRVGLMAYGKQTPADFYSQKLYELKALPNSPNNLTPLGRQQKESWRGPVPFEVRFPHPDRDVKVFAPVAASSALDAAKELNQFAIEECRGCTPLYYSIQQALDSGFGDLPRNIGGTRQVVVVSDGVNMPYESYDGAIGTTAGIRVNAADYQSLEAALSRHAEDTQVLVVLFGVSRQTPTDRQQLDALNSLETQHPNFRIREAPNAAELKRTIYAALPKAAIELRGTDAAGSGQKMEFNTPLAPRNWTTDGSLRRELVRQLVRLKPPGENRSIDKELDLLGGERVILQYEPRDGQLLYIGDELVRRTSTDVQSPRASDNRRLRFEALDPERVGLTINKLHFRLRDEDSARRFTPRPNSVWLEVRPLLAGGAPSDRAFPCIDVNWKENINLPRLQMPVEHWPECSTARVKAWLRFTDPQALAQVTIQRDRESQVVTAGQDKWQIEQTGGDGGAPRKITAIWEPADSSTGLSNLIDRAVWLSPPPDATRRQYALDGSVTIHEFTYNREDIGKVEIRIVSRSQFEQGAYSAELEFDVAN